MKVTVGPGVPAALLGAAVLFLPASPAWSDDDSRCHGLPSQPQLKSALDAAVQAETSGLNNHMWATIVNRDGIVCAVAFSGVDRSAQWPGSRVISAQKANTANAFSLDGSSGSGGSGQAAGVGGVGGLADRTEEHTSRLQPRCGLVRAQKNEK